jgi:hypothetical protein
MVNAWSLAASVIDGTLDEDYPMYGPEDERALVERNKKKFPATDDVTGILEYPDDDPYYGYEYTPLSSMTTEEANLHIHATSPYNDGWTQQGAQEKLDKLRKESERKRDGRYKYHESEIISDIEEYVSSTYNGHYTGNTHEYRNVQTIDLMAARSLASGFCQSNILKYGSRYGSKNGKDKKDLMKVIHYAMLLLHFDEHYGKPSITSGNIDHNMP